MSSEQPKSQSANYGFNEEWEAVGELGGIVGEAWLLPETILGDLIETAFGDSLSD